jgi:hypothetical protein
MARLARLGTSSSTGLLNAGAPTGIVMDGLAPKITWRSVPGTIAPLVPANVTHTSPTTKGCTPCLFDSHTVSRSPPMLMRTTWRTVSLLKPWGSGILGNTLVWCGLAAQVLTQSWSGTDRSGKRPVADATGSSTTLVSANTSAARKVENKQFDRIVGLGEWRTGSSCIVIVLKTLLNFSVCQH